MSNLGENAKIGDRVTLVLYIEELVFIQPRDVAHYNNKTVELDFLVAGEWKDHHRRRLFIVTDTTKYPDKIYELTQEVIDLYIEEEDNFRHERDYKYLGKVSDYLGKFGYWVDDYRVFHFQSPKPDPKNDGCRCRICTNFIFMAAPDAIGDGKISCRSCLDNPMRIYY